MLQPMALVLIHENKFPILLEARIDYSFDEIAGSLIYGL